MHHRHTGGARLRARGKSCACRMCAVNLTIFVLTLRRLGSCSTSSAQPCSRGTRDPRCRGAPSSRTLLRRPGRLALAHVSPRMPTLCLISSTVASRRVPPYLRARILIQCTLAGHARSRFKEQNLDHISSQRLSVGVERASQLPSSSLPWSHQHLGKEMHGRSQSISHQRAGRRTLLVTGIAMGSSFRPPLGNLSVERRRATSGPRPARPYRPSGILSIISTISGTN